MRKDGIKIIKQVNISEVEKTKAVKKIARSESDIRRRLGKVVKDWISERQENSRLEKLISESNILAWKYNQQN